MNHSCENTSLQNVSVENLQVFVTLPYPSIILVLALKVSVLCTYMAQFILNNVHKLGLKQQ